MKKSEHQNRIDFRNRVGLNFIRPDVNRPGNYDFVNNGVWLASQFEELGVKWNRLAFSWVLVQPEKGVFNWEPYDQVVEACDREGIEILATLGGHFDRPPVPTWAGNSLAEVLRNNPRMLENFIEAWVQRYKKFIHHWEILNEPRSFHKGLTVMEYIGKILKPSYRIIKSADPKAKVLPCAYNHLPIIGNKEDFWDAARGYYDVANLHIYQDWGMFRSRPTTDQDVEAAEEFRTLMIEHDEGNKDFWVTETGWWGTASLTGSIYEYYKKDPVTGIELQPSYTGKEVLEHPIVIREDKLRAEWMKNLFPRMLSVSGCEKVFLWVSLDEFEGGYDRDKIYGRSTEDKPASQIDLWGIIAGDKTWRKSAFTLQEILR